ncbi:hypothetical protein EOA30_10980 [Mesorhizobium sp. M8A.F.Ca.ET.059.01.1.1]|nr:hypothetical protein EOA30_10980 [Mesorhizobium sp. M8A.F.Ca.ET.059.01.1.1]
MYTAIAEAAFKPKPTVRENKGDATTQAARDIMDKETADRESKTQRLKLARLAKEAAEPVVLPKPKQRLRTRRDIAGAEPNATRHMAT